MYAILLTKGGRKKTKKKAREIVLLNLNIPVIFCLFSFFFEMARRGLRRAGSRKCNFLDGDKGRAVRRLVTSKLLPLHRDASKSHPRPRETRENKMAPGIPCKLLFEKCTGFSSDDYQLLSDVCSNDGPGYLQCIRVIAQERSFSFLHPSRYFVTNSSV